MLTFIIRERERERERERKRERERERERKLCTVLQRERETERGTVHWGVWAYVLTTEGGIRLICIISRQNKCVLIIFNDHMVPPFECKNVTFTRECMY